ncbi:unnamed protein product [Phytophthora lilii]|uniref:Unnamed protein product n=1 Tax=Phytophthora lilii TaxID=2077276 RepID=A0A9W6TH43_9STRA|nr:unnamed protein product [Phytophthora lilii]
MRSKCLGLSVAGVDFYVIQRRATRKYAENGRLVIISRTLIEPVLQCVNVSYSFVETTRIVLTPGEVSVLGPTTMIHAREATLCGDVSVFGDKLDVGISYWQQEITRYNNSLEDQLIRVTS